MYIRVATQVQVRKEMTKAQRAAAPLPGPAQMQHTAMHNNFDRIDCKPLWPHDQVAVVEEEVGAVLTREEAAMAVKEVGALRCSVVQCVAV